VKSKREKERYTHLNAECQRIARSDYTENPSRNVTVIRLLIHLWKFLNPFPKKKLKYWSLQLKT